MTLEQRIEALEKAVASLTLQDTKSEQLAKMMLDVASEVIKNARRPGGMLYKNESGKESAAWGVKITPANGQITGFNKEYRAGIEVSLQQIDDIIRNAEALEQLGSSVSAVQQEETEERINFLEQKVNDLVLQISSLDSSTSAGIAAIHAAKFNILG